MRGRRPTRRHPVVVLVALVLLLAPGGMASAQDGVETDGPTITLDRAAVRPGERVLVTLDGFRGTAVTISVCGNAARRGSLDCNLTASEGLGLDRDGSSTLAEMPVAVPPTTCPCVLRATTATFDEVAVAPIELIGHPTGPVVGASDVAPVDVHVEARRAPRGVVGHLRAALGGPTAYEVTVTVRNRSTEALPHLSMSGAARRGTDDVVALAVHSPGTLAPGQTWREVVQATVPAPAVGRIAWEVTASTGATSSVTGRDQAGTIPPGLVLLTLLFLVDVTAIAWRRVARRRAFASTSPLVQGGAMSGS